MTNFLKINKGPTTNKTSNNEALSQQVNTFADLWHSPSDVLEELIQLEPPYTSRVVKGKTHDGIIEIGKKVLEKEGFYFDRYVDSLKKDHDKAWAHIEKLERESVDKKVKEVYSKIFSEKNRIIQSEMSIFFEQILQDLQAHIKDEVETVSIQIDASITSNFNIEIQKRLKRHRFNLNKILEQNYNIEVNKLKTYYKQLLRNEQCVSNKKINKALCERNDALNAFYKEIEADKITSTMYVMCMEKKKYKVKQFLLERYHDKEIRETLAQKEQLESLKQCPNQSVSELYLKWQEKINKIIQLLLKFISFSLKILPEQTTFLLDLQKMFTLQLNVIQKKPLTTSSVLIDVAEVNNVFKFENYEKDENVCEADPFFIEAGDVFDVIKEGNRYILPTDRDLPYVRVERKFVYAKCQKMEEVRKFIDSQLCKCNEGFIRSPKPETPQSLLTSTSSSSSPTSPCTKTMTGPKYHGSSPLYLGTPLPSNVLSSVSVSVPKSTSHFFNSCNDYDNVKLEHISYESSGETSSNKTHVIENLHRLQDCPAKTCKKINRNLFFPNDFDEFNCERVNTILGDATYEVKSPPKRINLKSKLAASLPFNATGFYSNVGVQYLTEDVGYVTSPLHKSCACPCGHYPIRFERDIGELTDKRRKSILKLIQQHPSLLKILSLDP